MIPSTEIPHIVSALRQTDNKTRVRIATDLMSRAKSFLNLQFGCPEEAISLCVGIISNPDINRREQATAQVLALCANAVEKNVFSVEASSQLGYLLGNSVGFDDEAQSTRAKRPRANRTPLKKAFNVVALAHPNWKTKDIAKKLEVGVNLPTGEFVKIEYDVKGKFIPVVNGERLASICPKTFSQYRDNIKPHKKKT